MFVFFVKKGLLLLIVPDRFLCEGSEIVSGRETFSSSLSNSEISHHKSFIKWEIDFVKQAPQNYRCNVFIHPQMVEINFLISVAPVLISKSTVTVSACKND